MRWAVGTTITEDLARRSIELVTAVSAGRRRPLLVDMSGVKAMTREARGVYGGNENMTALALVGQSPVVRVIANFALNLNGPGVPTRFCSTAAEAESWLSGYAA
jgi:hypothetical protein